MSDVIEVVEVLNVSGWEVFARIRAELVELGEMEALVLAWERNMEALINQESEFDR